jgi:hypothetical protein
MFSNSAATLPRFFENFTATCRDILDFCHDTAAIFGIFACRGAAIFAFLTATNICLLPASVIQL